MSHNFAHRKELYVKHFAVATALLAACSAARAQDLMLDAAATTQPATQPANTFVLTEPESRHLERQAVVSLERVNTALNTYPPTTGEVAPERAMALTLLDAIDDISVTGTAVPEPAALGLVAVSGTELLARRRRRSV